MTAGSIRALRMEQPQADSSKKQPPCWALPCDWVAREHPSPLSYPQEEHFNDKTIQLRILLQYFWDYMKTANESTPKRISLRSFDFTKNLLTSFSARHSGNNFDKSLPGKHRSSRKAYGIKVRFSWQWKEYWERNSPDLLLLHRPQTWYIYPSQAVSLPETFILPD